MSVSSRADLVAEMLGATRRKHEATRYPDLDPYRIVHDVFSDAHVPPRLGEETAALAKTFPVHSGAFPPGFGCYLSNAPVDKGFRTQEYCMKWRYGPPKTGQLVPHKNPVYDATAAIQRKPGEVPALSLASH